MQHYYILLAQCFSLYGGNRTLGQQLHSDQKTVYKKAFQTTASRRTKNSWAGTRPLADHAIDFEKTANLGAMFFSQAEKFSQHPLLWRKVDGTYQPLPWALVATEIRHMAHALSQRITPGERVVIVAENRPEWLIADLAILVAGGISVPSYTTHTVADVLHVLSDCAASLVICSGSQAAKATQAAIQLSAPPRFVVLDDVPLKQNPNLDLELWDTVLSEGKTLTASAAALPGLQAQRDDIACLIYTSGTGGAPKGVMLSHGAILHNCRGAHDVLLQLGLDAEVFLSFLPLSHAYEHTAGQFFPLSIGAQIAYAESIDALAGNMLEVRPTIMTAVPRLYEVLRQKIIRGIEREGGAKLRWFNRTLSLGQKRLSGQRLSPVEWLQDRLCDLLVRRKVRARFGGRLKAFVSGGAPLNAEVGGFFTALGVCILQGYGQTEAAPVISVNLPGRVRLDAVGPPLHGTEVKIADDGEICVRGEMMMKGYWNAPKATAKAIDADGWLHTGDIGEMSSQGDLKITDRKKDIIVNSGGDNISPQRIEGYLTLEPAIAQALIYGDRRPHLVALIVPADPIPSDPAVRATLETSIREALGRVNQGLSAMEKIRKFTLADAPFTPENGMLTPTVKLRRHAILDIYRERLESLY
jgi:long-chain acyl-CoA synthetase